MSEGNRITEVLRFFGRIDRPLTPLEVLRAIGGEKSLDGVLKELSELVSTGRLKVVNGFYSLPEFSGLSRRLAQDVASDGKWKIFIRLRKLFNYIPFVRFACAAGSMAMGNPGPNSDFDVIVGARSGRIFTTRFFAVLVFGLSGSRRKKLTHHEEAKDKICLNHFVTEKSYVLQPPHNLYWEQLYRNLVPLHGSDGELKKFYDANAWSGTRYLHDLRSSNAPAPGRVVAEWLLGGVFGDLVERVLGYLQKRRIEKGLKGNGFKPRIIFNENELEFHPDTARIEKLIN